jgi:UDP-glucose 4-epimerase
MEPTHSRVIVTGGAGFIGSHVVDQLVEQGADVLVVDDLSTGSLANLGRHLGGGQVEIEKADIRDPLQMREVLRDADMVIHMAVASLRASLSDPISVHEVNATGTLTVCQAAHGNGIRRVVYVSSSEAYGSARTVPMAESHPLDPTTVYGASKAAGELYTTSYAKTYGLEAMVVRPFNTYGPREHAEGTSAEVIPKFVMRGLAGLPPVVFGDGRQTRDFTWVEETARGIILAAHSDRMIGRQVNIARGQEVSIARVSQLILEALGRTDLRPHHDDERPGDVARHYADVRKARELFGFEASVDIVDGIQQYVAWVRNQDLDVSAWVEREVVRNW